MGKIRKLLYFIAYPSGGGNDNSPQSSCLENSMDRGAWWATVHEVTKPRLSD